MEKRVIVMTGEKVNLVIPEAKDTEIMFHGINNPEIQFLIGQMKQYYRENEDAFYKSKVDSREILFMIQEKNSGEIMGSVGFVEESQIHRNGILGIVIYDEKNHSLGYGSEAIMLFEKYVFEFLGYEKIVLRVHAINERAIKAYKKCGFQEVGILKRDQYLKGQYYDTLMMEVMKEDYFTHKK